MMRSVIAKSSVIMMPVWVTGIRNVAAIIIIVWIWIRPVITGAVRQVLLV
jgi:hypothetical protein